MLDHFSRSELACPTTDELRLATGFGEALERLRVELDAPIYLTSACRSPTHNAKVGGHPRSLHLTVNGHWGTGLDHQPFFMGRVFPLMPRTTLAGSDHRYYCGIAGIASGHEQTGTALARWGG